MREREREVKAFRASNNLFFYFLRRVNNYFRFNFSAYKKSNSNRVLITPRKKKKTPSKIYYLLFCVNVAPRIFFFFGKNPNTYGTKFTRKGGKKEKILFRYRILSKILLSSLVRVFCCSCSCF